jgi:hypothetical protein
MNDFWVEVLVKIAAASLLFGLSALLVLVQ